MIVNVGTNKFNVKTVTTTDDISKGMMGKKFDDSYNGMLFMLKRGTHAFWMKNCIIPLDIIFIDKNKITKIYHNCPPCTDDNCPNYIGFGDKVLELKGGTCRKLHIEKN